MGPWGSASLEWSPLLPRRLGARKRASRGLDWLTIHAQLGFRGRVSALGRSQPRQHTGSRPARAGGQRPRHARLHSTSKRQRRGAFENPSLALERAQFRSTTPTQETLPWRRQWAMQRWGNNCSVPCLISVSHYPNVVNTRLNSQFRLKTKRKRFDVHALEYITCFARLRFTLFHPRETNAQWWNCV